MGKNKTWVWIAIGAVAAVIVLVLIFTQGGDLADSLGIGTPKTQQKEDVLQGISPVRGGEVVAPSGVTAKNNVAPGSVNAPQQSIVVDETSIPPTAIKIKASSDGFSPSTFEVLSGSVVTLALTSEDDSSYTLAFEDPALSAVTVGVGRGETRATNFKAPSPGTYDFRSIVPGHATKGLVGKMIVK